MLLGLTITSSQKLDHTCESVNENCVVINIYKLFYMLASKGEAEKQLGLVSGSLRRVKATVVKATKPNQMISS